MTVVTPRSLCTHQGWNLGNWWINSPAQLLAFWKHTSRWPFCWGKSEVLIHSKWPKWTAALGTNHKHMAKATQSENFCPRVSRRGPRNWHCQVAFWKCPFTSLEHGLFTILHIYIYKYIVNIYIYIMCIYIYIYAVYAFIMLYVLYIYICIICVYIYIIIYVYTYV